MSADRLPIMNPGPKFFGHVTFSVEVWIDPTRSDAVLDPILDNVDITARNAIEAAMKEIAAPDHGIEVVVR